MTDPTIDQNGWVQVADDESESLSTFLQEELIDGGWQQRVNVVFRVRFEMVHTGGDAANGRSYALQFDHNTAGFVAVGAATPIQFDVSAEDGWTITDGDNCTDRITGDAGTFVAGTYSEDAVASSANVGVSEHNEVEYCVSLDGAQVADGDTIALRCVMSGAQMTPTYGATPTINVTLGSLEFAARFTGDLPPARRPAVTQVGGMIPSCFEEPPILIGKAA